MNGCGLRQTMTQLVKMAALSRRLEGNGGKRLERQGVDGGDAVAYLTFSVIPWRTSRDPKKRLKCLLVLVLMILLASGDRNFCQVCLG